MSPLARLLALAVTGYQTLVSPLVPAHCRFAPSCSSYALEALRVHGALRGGWLVLRRVARCHPFHPGGHDPVPAAGRTRRGDSNAPAGAMSEDGNAMGEDGSLASRRPATGPAARSSAPRWGAFS